MVEPKGSAQIFPCAPRRERKKYGKCHPRADGMIACYSQCPDQYGKRQQASYTGAQTQPIAPAVNSVDYREIHRIPQHVSYTQAQITEGMEEWYI